MSRQPVIDGAEFAVAGATQNGVMPLSGFPRLRDLLASDAGEVAYAVKGVRDERGRPSLRVSVHGTLQLRCQRCLETLPHAVEADELLVLAASQTEIDAAPVDAQSPDRVIAAAEMPVRDLIEDELILAVPYAPMHAKCEGRPSPGEQGKTSPFAGLRGLIRGGH
jgi:uncharacterized protein